jgi:hypothetical protein
MRKGAPMKAPGLVPSQVRERLIVLPEAAPPKRRRRLRIAGVLALVVWTALVAGIGVYVWQRGEIRSRDRAIARSRLAAADANARSAEASASAASLRERLLAEQGLLVQAQHGETLARIEAGAHQRQIANLQTKLASRDASLGSVLGPRLRNGDHIAYLVGVDATGSRLLIDTGRWFTGAAARRAASRDGVAGRLVNGRYLHDPDHVLRYVQVVAGTPVTLRNVRASHRPTTTTLSGLGTIFGKGDEASDTIRLDPFWIHVQHGEIDAITQQQYRPPA